jgi:hypothetical protein
MTVRKNTAPLFRMTFLAAAVMYAAGCGNSSSRDTKSEESVWTPDPRLVSQLKQTGEVGDYRLSLPPEFTAVEVPRRLPGNMKMATWKGKARAGEALASLSVALVSDERAANEARNMRQFLVNYSAGVTETVGIKISRREVTETGELGGIGFSRFRWSGTTPDGTAVRGLVYGAIDKGQVIAIIAMNFGASAETENKLMEAAIATFKRR